MFDIISKTEIRRILETSREQFCIVFVLSYINVPDIIINVIIYAIDI